MARSIAIIGRHPVLEPGFNAAMSLNEALGFEALGCEVTLYLPVGPEHDPDALLAASGFPSYDALPRFGGSFAVVPLRASAEVVGADVLVWQSYRKSEHNLLMEFAGRSVLRTKNPPRLFSGHLDHDRRKAQGLLNQVDLVAVSLRADEDVVGRTMGDLSARFRHVPRGFNAEWLTGSGRGSTPVIGLDRAVRAADNGARARRHIVDSLLRLRADRFDFDVLTLRETLPELGSERIPNLPLLSYYERFINRLWIYLPIDFEHSVHVGGYTRSPAGERLFVGLYENQIVEAQIAGALVVARRGDVPTELIMLPDESIIEDYDDLDAVIAAIRAHLENFASRSAQTRRAAVARHTHVAMARAWLNAIDAVR